MLTSRLPSVRSGAAWPGPALGLCYWLLSVTAFSAPRAANLSRYEYTQPQMGVPFRMVLYAPD